MENLLLKYLVDRFNEESSKDEPLPDLPFITISRQYGCNAKGVAEYLVQKLTRSGKNVQKEKPWSWISKEILDVAARELDVDNGRVRALFSHESPGAVEQFLTSFTSKYYKSDPWILKSVTSVIRDFASKGHVVIVGRGGVAVTRKMKNGFHVRLCAPLEWRAKKLVEKGDFSVMKEAKDYCKVMDDARQQLVQKLNGGNMDDSMHHMIYYCQHFTEEMIADSIVATMRALGLIRNAPS